MKKDKIKGAIKTLEAGLKFNGYNPEITSPHIITWATEMLPYEALQGALDLVMTDGRKGTMVKDFNFYCKTMGGDSLAWQVTLHIKELELKP